GLRSDCSSPSPPPDRESHKRSSPESIDATAVTRHGFPPAASYQDSTVAHPTATAWDESPMPALAPRAVAGHRKADQRGLPPDPPVALPRAPQPPAGAPHHAGLYAPEVRTPRFSRHSDEGTMHSSGTRNRSRDDSADHRSRRCCRTEFGRRWALQNLR